MIFGFNKRTGNYDIFKGMYADDCPSDVAKVTPFTEQEITDICNNAILSKIEERKKESDDFVDNLIDCRLMIHDMVGRLYDWRGGKMPVGAIATDYLPYAISKADISMSRLDDTNPFVFHIFISNVKYQECVHIFINGKDDRVLIGSQDDNTRFTLKYELSVADNGLHNFIHDVLHIMERNKLDELMGGIKHE